MPKGATRLGGDTKTVEVLDATVKNLPVRDHRVAPMADVGHGAWHLSLLSHFPLALFAHLRYNMSIRLTLLSAAWRRYGTAV